MREEGSSVSSLLARRLAIPDLVLPPLSALQCLKPRTEGAAGPGVPGDASEPTELLSLELTPAKCFVSKSSWEIPTGI